MGPLLPKKAVVTVGGALLLAGTAPFVVQGCGSSDCADDSTCLGATRSSEDAGASPRAEADAAVACTSPRCSGPSTLERCDGTTEECRFICVEEPTAHCGVIQPSGQAVTTADLEVAGVGDVVLTSTVFNTATGAIEGLRMGNVVPGSGRTEVANEIGFRVAKMDDTHQLAIWLFKSLTVPKDVTVDFTSENAAAFVVSTTLDVAGVIDLRGVVRDEGRLVHCWLPFGTEEVGEGMGGPGAGRGGADGSTKGKGPGGGGPAKPDETLAGAPGGGGYGAFGGAGGNGGDSGKWGGDGGAPYGSDSLIPLLAGSGGGGGRGETRGGGGGGAIHLVAGRLISMGGGGERSGINAGGCGGGSAGDGRAGGGGGSGGAILLETPTLEMKANAVLAANGGGGGTGGGGAGGGDGVLGDLGGAGDRPLSSSYAQSYAGGSASHPAGRNGESMVGQPGGGGSGSGAAGRIRINVRAGSFTLPAGAIISPVISTPALKTPTTIGTLIVH